MAHHALGMQTRKYNRTNSEIVNNVTKALQYQQYSRKVDILDDRGLPRVAKW